MRPEPVTVVARRSAFRTASSVASRAAWKSGESASVGSSVRARALSSPWRTRRSSAVEKAIA